MTNTKNKNGKLNDFKNNLKYHLKLFKIQFRGLRKELKCLLFLSILSVLITELILNKISSFSQILFDLGIIYIKLCYSYMSAFLFYYLVVYSPKERKRVKGFRLLNNIIHELNVSIESILITIIKVNNPKTIALDKEISLEKIENYCKMVNPNSPVKFLNTDIILHKSFYEFIEFKTQKIKYIINELILLHDLVDDNLFLNFSNISDILSHLRPEYLIYPEKDLNFMSYYLYDLYFEKNELFNHFMFNYCKKYDFQYHRNERIRNKRRKLKE